jgi:protein N-lysine methyltransferase METTL21A
MDIKTRMFSLDHFHQTYDTTTTPVTINGHTLSLLTPASIDRFIDPDDALQDFPLWAKIWEASILLASYLSSLPPNPSKTMLEIGSGLGMVGIAAAKAGHRMTLSERNPDALNFARANALTNGCPSLSAERLDWHAPHLEDRFDYIVGSEVVYQTEAIDCLESLFDRYLSPGGTIILAEGVRRTGVDFWDRMRHNYDVKARRQTLRSDGGTRHMVLFHLQRKTDRQFDDKAAES